MVELQSLFTFSNYGIVKNRSSVDSRLPPFTHCNCTIARIKNVIVDLYKTLPGIDCEIKCFTKDIMIDVITPLLIGVIITFASPWITSSKECVILYFITAGPEALTKDYGCNGFCDMIGIIIKTFFSM